MSARLSYVAHSAHRVLVLTNFSAGSRPREEAIRGLLVRLKERGLAGEVITDLVQFDQQVARCHASGQLRAVVAAGGDGTIAEIVNRTPAEVPVTVFPMGTANLLANYLGLTHNARELAATLAAGATMRLDTGRANGRIFLLMAGCGFDADVVARLHRKRSGGNISYWTWASPLVDSVRNYGYPDLRISCDTGEEGPAGHLEYRARWAFAVNLPCYAGGLQVAPHAVGTDGLLDVSTFDKGSFWHGLRYVGLVALGWHQVLSDYRTVPVKRVRIESSEPVPYQLDGDPGGMLPLEVEVLVERMTVLAPATRLVALAADRHAVEPAEAST